MCETRALFRITFVLVLLVNSGGKRRCNYTEILGTYRRLISTELQNLNITTSYNSSKGKSPCPSVKAHRILGSIYDMTLRMRCQIGDKKSDLNRPLENMEQVIIHNCSPDYLGKPLSCVKKIQRKKKKRMQLIGMIKDLTVCWQKLHSAFSGK